MNWYIDVLKKYTVFDGRAQRAEYWYFILFHLCAIIILSIVDGILGTVHPVSGIGYIGMIYMLAVLLPAIGVGIRRLHDTGRTGWWLLISFIPFIGPIVLLIFFVQDSAPGDNEYGPNPKGV